jgi:hypothetical protein
LKKHAERILRNADATEHLDLESTDENSRTMPTAKGKHKTTSLIADKKDKVIWMPPWIQTSILLMP